MGRILLVDDDERYCKMFSGILSRQSGHDIDYILDETRIDECLDNKDYQLLLLDLDFRGDVIGDRILKGLQNRLGCPPVIILTDLSDTRIAVETTKLGAFDFLEKGRDDLDRIVLTVNNAIEQHNLKERLRSGQRILGKHKRIKELREQIARFANSEQIVLITGETGTGKELVASALHTEGKRVSQPYVVKNSAATPEGLVESDLFGYRDRIFTGGDPRGRDGAFIAAGKGTLFLDEIGDMSLSVQAKVLRALDTRKIQKLGYHDQIPYQARVVAATKQDLKEKVRKGEFRDDLLYRLDVLRIHVPPLRDHVEDIPELFDYYLSDSFREERRHVPEVHAEVYSLLSTLDWPDNVRGLVHLTKKLACGADSDSITADVLREHLPDVTQGQSDQSLAGVVANAEREAVVSALAQHGQNVERAAVSLGVGKWSLYKIIEKHGISLRGKRT